MSLGPNAAAVMVVANVQGIGRVLCFSVGWCPCTQDNSLDCNSLYSSRQPPCGLHSCKNRPVAWSNVAKRRPNQALSVLYLSMFLLYCLLVPVFMYCQFSLVCVMSWLFWLSCQFLLSDWLERLLRKPNRGEGIISIKRRPNSVYDFLGLLY